MTDLLVEGILAAPPAAGPLEAVAHALETLGRAAFTADRRELSARRQAVLAANPELREREALKRVNLTASMVEALIRRAVPDLSAHAAAKLGALAWELALDQWHNPDNREEFGPLARQKVAEVRAASLECVARF